MSRSRDKFYAKERKPKPYKRTKMRQDTQTAVDQLRTQRKVVTT